MYNYIVLSTPTAFLCNFLHKKMNSNKFAFFRVMSIIITVQRTSDNEPGRKPHKRGASRTRALGQDNRSLTTLHCVNELTKETALCLWSKCMER